MKTSDVFKSLDNKVEVQIKEFDEIKNEHKRRITVHVDGKEALVFEVSIEQVWEGTCGASEPQLVHQLNFEQK